MENKNTLNYQLSEKVRNMAKKDYGLGRIFNHLRKMELCKNLSDLAILRLSLFELKKLEKMPSNLKIKHHFRTKVAKEEWLGSSKKELLKDLYDPRF